MTEPSTEIELRRETARQQLVNPTTDGWTAVVREVSTLANQIAGTEFVPKDLRDSSAKITAAILHGRELGLPPMTALASTHIVHGRPGISAEAMRGLVFQAGHAIVVTESTGATCTVKGKRSDLDEWIPVTWTMAMAQAAGLPQRNPQTWKAYPRQMLQARATTELCRLVFPDVIHGMHSVEELQDLAGGAEVPAGPVEEPSKPGTVQRARRSKQPAKPAAAVEQIANDQEQSKRQRPPIPERGRTEPPPPDDPEAKAAEEAAQAERERQQEELRKLSEEHRNDPDAEPLNASNQGAEPDTGADGQPIQDAEVITDDAPKIAAGQRAALMGHWKRLGVEDRDERLIMTAYFAGRDRIESTNELTVTEAVRVLGAVEKLRDREALDQALNSDPLPLNEGDDQK